MLCSKQELRNMSLHIYLCFLLLPIFKNVLSDCLLQNVFFQCSYLFIGSSLNIKKTFSETWHFYDEGEINLLATDFFFQILAHPVFKM